MYDPSGLYVDPILTNFSTGYQSQSLYGWSIMPETPVSTQSGKYRVYDRSAWLIHNSRREPGTVANEIVGAKWSEDTFYTQEHSLQSPVFDEERQALTSQGGIANDVFGGDLQIDPEADAVDTVMGSIMLEHEKKVADLARNTANYAAGNFVTLAGANQFDDYTYVTAGIPDSIVSNPVAAIMTGMRTIYSKTGRYPNTLAIPTLGAGFIENHPRIVARFSNFALTDEEAFRKLTGFQGRIILVDSVYNAADNVDAAENITTLWGKDIWLGIVDPQPGQRTKTFGKTFAQRYPDGNLRPTEKWREEPRKADLVRSNYKYDLKVVSNVAGYIIKTAFSAGAWT
jgi:hypothetical protein